MYATYEDFQHYAMKIPYPVLVENDHLWIYLSVNWGKSQAGAHHNTTVVGNVDKGWDKKEVLKLMVLKEKIQLISISVDTY